MDRRQFDRHWIWLGVLLGFIVLTDYAKRPEVGLVVLSIFFGGLLAVASILPNVQNYKKIKFIKESGHMKDLVNYIHFPLVLSFILIVIEFFSKIIIFPEIILSHIVIFDFVYLSLWGLFLCSLFRIICLVVKLINDDSS